MRIMSLAAAMVLAVTGSAVALADQVVYDNTSTPTTGTLTPAGFFKFSQFNNYEPTGDEITLAPGDRVLKEFHVMLSSSEPTTLDTLSLSLAMNDNATDWYSRAPGTEICSWQLSDVSVNGLTRLVFSAPQGVTVNLPNSFTWLVSAGSSVAGLATFDPPTVGASGNSFWTLSADDGEWYKNGLFEQRANFGAAVIVVPEPACMGLLLVGALAVRRRREHRA